MAVYEHQQNDWRAYRVARSVDGKLHQAYFPHTSKGYREANRLDHKLAKQQANAQAFFTGHAARWNPKRSPKIRAK